MICYKALSLWNAGRYSGALSNSAVVLELLAKRRMEEQIV